MVERLTKRDGILVHPVYLGDFGSANVLERLAEYEDGGLEPYHIPSILSNNHKIIEKCKQLQSENSNLKLTMCKKENIMKLLESCYDDYCKAFDNLPCGCEACPYNEYNTGDYEYGCKDEYIRRKSELLRGV